MATKKNRWKGCCYMCGAHKDKRAGADSVPWTVLRRLGQKRRLRKVTSDD